MPSALECIIERTNSVPLFPIVNVGRELSCFQKTDPLSQGKWSYHPNPKGKILRLLVSSLATIMRATFWTFPEISPPAVAGVQFAVPSFFAVMCSTLLVLRLSNPKAFKPLIDSPVSGLLVPWLCIFTDELILLAQVLTSLPESITMVLESAASSHKVSPGICSGSNDSVPIRFPPMMWCVRFNLGILAPVYELRNSLSE